MKKRSMKRALSAVLTLCMALPGASVAFGSVSAATVSDDSSTSASSTAAGSLVEDDGFTWDNANVYFLLTDRFKNGNTANDHSYGRTLDKDGKPLDGWDTNPGTFHGGDFAGVTQSIEEGYFDNLGVTQFGFQLRMSRLTAIVIQVRALLTTHITATMFLTIPKLMQTSVQKRSSKLSLTQRMSTVSELSWIS